MTLAPTVAIGIDAMNFVAVAVMAVDVTAAGMDVVTAAGTDRAMAGSGMAVRLATRRVVTNVRPATKRVETAWDNRSLRSAKPPVDAQAATNTVVVAVLATMASVAGVMAPRPTHKGLRAVNRDVTGVSRVSGHRRSNHVRRVNHGNRASRGKRGSSASHATRGTLASNQREPREPREPLPQQALGGAATAVGNDSGAEGPFLNGPENRPDGVRPERAEGERGPRRSRRGGRRRRRDGGDGYGQGPGGDARGGGEAPSEGGPAEGSSDFGEPQAPREPRVPEARSFDFSRPASSDERPAQSTPAFTASTYVPPAPREVAPPVRESMPAPPTAVEPREWTPTPPTDTVTPRDEP